MVFVFDLDDTLCETDEFSRQWIARFFEEQGAPLRQVTDRSRYSEGYFNWTTEQAVAWYKEFGDEMMENFPPKDGVVEFLRFLRKNGHRVVIATAREKNWHNEPEKVTCEWLAKNGIEVDEIFVGRADKEAVCLGCCADVFVDDDLSIVEKVTRLFAGSERKAFLMTTNFNRTLPTPEGAIRIEKLSDLSKFLNL